MNSHSDDAELLEGEVDFVVETAPRAFAELIRTKEDALKIHRVIRGHMEGLECGRDQCQSIGGFLMEWDSPEFSKGYAKEIERAVGELDVFCREYDEFADLETIRISFEALSIAADRHAEEVEKAAERDNRTGGNAEEAMEGGTDHPDIVGRL